MNQMRKAEANLKPINKQVKEAPKYCPKTTLIALLHDHNKVQQCSERGNKRGFEKRKKRVKKP